ncbi:MAG: SDR family NAD(P)-dependent oxidoreductase [Brumimicrobium sp.]|nr:SDR family NAD(P)-dependent oxidoreductase [Brumimicrobium sp.]
MKQFAIITGASRGLGRVFATEMAKLKHNLILISLPNEGLSEFSSELLAAYGVDIINYEIDLSNKEIVCATAQDINEKYQVFFLINNAGIGGTKDITKIDLGYIHKIIELNVLGTTTLIHQLLPNLMKQSKSYILNISSLAALTPIGYKTVYPASKAFIHHFSLGLRQELKTTSVSVSVVHPGAMATNPDVTKRMKEQGVLGKLTQLNIEKVAKKCIHQTLHGKRVIVVNRISWTLMYMLPTRMWTHLITKGVKKEINM